MAFESAPDWRLLETLPAEIALRGYRHKTKKFWLLDCWNVHKYDEFPFTGFPSARMVKALPADATVERLARIYREVIKEDGGGVALEEETFVIDAAKIAVQIAKNLGKRTFLFAGDDDGLDIAFYAQNTGLERARISYGWLQLVLEDNIWGVAPLSSEGMVGLLVDRSAAQVEECQRVVTKLNQDYDVKVLPSRNADDFQYANAYKEWPEGTVDPVSVLEYVESDQPISDAFVTEFERIATITSEMKEAERMDVKAFMDQLRGPKKWWQFWRS